MKSWQSSYEGVRVPVAVTRKLRRVASMKMWLDSMCGDTKSPEAVQDEMREDTIRPGHRAWWTDFEGCDVHSMPDQIAAARLDGRTQWNESGREMPNSPKHFAEKDPSSILEHPLIQQLLLRLEAAEQKVPDVAKLRKLQCKSFIGGGWKATMGKGEESREKLLDLFQRAIDRGANPDIATEGSSCYAASHIATLALTEGSEDDVRGAFNFMLSLGISPSDCTLLRPSKWKREDCPPVVDCFQLAAAVAERRKTGQAGGGLATWMSGKAEEDVKFLEEQLGSQRAYVQQLVHRHESRLERLLSSAPPECTEETNKIRSALRSLNIRSFAELAARKSELSKTETSWLMKSIELMKKEPASGNSEVRVVVVCVDRHLGQDPETIAVFQDHCSKRRAIIPVILPGLDIKDYSQWWPEIMNELADHALFVDYRFGDKTAWKLKTETELLPQINKFLEEWRGEAADDFQDAFQVSASIPCQECVRTGVPNSEVYHFNREESLKKLEYWRSEKLRALQQHEVEDAGDAGAQGGEMALLEESEEQVKQKCARGHPIRLVDILSRAVIFKSVQCPQCLHFGDVPAHCFNRAKCLLYFSEGNTSRVGLTDCPQCRDKGRDGAMRILDLFPPDVFLSYNWGVTTVVDGKKCYSTQVLVTPLKERLEREEDILCWFDVQGGMGAGQNLKAEMEVRRILILQAGQALTLVG